MAVREDMLATLCGGEISHLVLLHPAEGELPAEVESALGYLAASCPRFTEPLLAFVEIALHDRLDSTRSAWGLATPGMICLVVVGAEHCEDLEPLLVNIGSYFGRVAVVNYDKHSRDGWRVRLNPAATPQVIGSHPFRRAQSGNESHPARSRGGMTDPPSLRLVNQGSPLNAAAPPDPSSNEETDLDESTPSVTRDEIAMLLRGDAADNDDGPAARREAAP